MREFGRIIDNIVTHYGVEDVRMLADNVVTILDTVKNLTQPEMLKSVDNAVKVFRKPGDGGYSRIFHIQGNARNE